MLDTVEQPQPKASKVLKVGGGGHPKRKLRGALGQKEYSRILKEDSRRSSGRSLDLAGRLLLLALRLLGTAENNDKP